MLRSSLPTLIIAAGLLSACNNADDASSVEQTVPDSSGQLTALATADLKAFDGKAVGTVTLLQNAGELGLSASISGLGSGERAFHLHETGACDGPDFKTAGGHLNPMGKSHGSMNPDGAHLGDLPNLALSESQFSNDIFSLDGSVDDLISALFDSDGTAVVLHEGPDDYVSDPAGNAGARVACGVLTRTGGS